MKKKILKLKDLLKESYVWERKFGEKLPTLADVQKKYENKKKKKDEGFTSGTSKDKENTKTRYKNFLEHLKSKVVELEKVPGSKGFTHNPEYNTSSEKPNLANMTAQERAAFYINNK